MTGRETEKFLEELADIQTKSFDKAMQLAEKYGEDKNVVAYTLASSLCTTVANGDFSKYKVGGEEE